MAMIPNSLWQWFQEDYPAYRSLNESMACHRPAWFYQRIYATAPLHALTKEIFPSAGVFWSTWAVCPQMISLAILRKHFTAHTWLNYSFALNQLNDTAMMILKPRAHFKMIPLRALGLGFMWFSNMISDKIYSDSLKKTFTKISSYIMIAMIPMQLFGLTMSVATVASGSLGWNPLKWEEIHSRNEATGKGFIAQKIQQAMKGRPS